MGAPPACWLPPPGGSAAPARPLGAELVDIDEDGTEELVLRSEHLFAVLAPACGGRLVYLACRGPDGGVLVIGNPTDDWNRQEEMNSYMDVPANHPGGLADGGGVHDRYEVTIHAGERARPGGAGERAGGQPAARAPQADRPGRRGPPRCWWPTTCPRRHRGSRSRRACRRTTTGCSATGWQSCSDAEDAAGGAPVTAGRGYGSPWPATRTPHGATPPGPNQVMACSFVCAPRRGPSTCSSGWATSTTTWRSGGCRRGGNGSPT